MVLLFFFFWRVGSVIVDRCVQYLLHCLYVCMCVVISKKWNHNGYNTAIILVSEFKRFRYYKGEHSTLVYATSLVVKKFL